MPGSSPRRCSRDRAAAFPGRRPAGLAAADGCGAHDRDARPAVGRAPADQRRDRRRPCREQGRRHFPQPCRALRGHRASSCTSTRRCSPARRSTSAGKHISRRGRAAAVPAGAGAASAALFRRLVARTAIDVAAEHVDKYLTWGEPPALVAEKIAKVNAAARPARGRTLSFGIRLHVIVRETAEEAWAAADRLIAHLDDETIAKAQSVFARMDSVGQQRMARCMAAGATSSWSARTCGPASGSCAAAPARRSSATRRRSRRACEEYRSLGIDTFILSGYPHLEEAYRFAELVFPLLPLGHAPERTALAVNTGPFGETIANEIRPAARKAS